MLPFEPPTPPSEVEALREELERTRELLRAVLRASPDPIYVKDAERRLVEVNPAFSQCQGVPPDSVVGRRATEVFPSIPASGEWVGHLCGSAADDARVLAGEVVDQPKVMVVHGDRTLHTYSTRVTPLRDGAGRVWGLLGYARDLTDLSRAEEAREQSTESFRDIVDGLLHEAESNFRSLVESLPEAVLVAQDGRYAWANPAALRLLGGASMEQVIGLMPSRLLEPGVGSAFADSVSGVGARPGAVDGRWLRLDGTSVSVEVSAFKGMFDGRPAHVVVARDSTSRNELAARLAQIDRLLAVGTLAAGVGHEINNPLAYVVANIEFVARELGGANRSPADLTGEAPRASVEVLQALAEAREGAGRVRAIVRDLKSFSRGEEHERQPVDLRVVLDSAVSMAMAEIRHRAQLVKEYGEVLPVDGNESRLAQVFLNLLVNAAHAIPEGRADHNRIRVVLAGTAIGGASVEVHDTGSGIPAEILPRVFDPFFTTKPVGKGTGLGLSICQNIVRSFEGEITVESQVGRGTVVRVVLPPSRLELPSARPVSRPQLKPARRARLLIVDDEVMVASALRRGLGDLHDVETCTRAQDALNRLTTPSAFDLVFCDLMMPEMTGMEFFHRLQLEKPEYASRVIFLTGGAFTERAQQFLAEVSNRRLEKPFEIKMVRALVQEMLDSTPEPAASRLQAPTASLS